MWVSWRRLKLTSGKIFAKLIKRIPGSATSISAVKLKVCCGKAMLGRQGQIKYYLFY